MGYSILIFALLLVSVGMYGYYFSDNAIIKRALRKVPAKRIGDFRDGDTGRITGRVVFAGKTLIAPLSKRPCAWFDITVEEYYRTHSNRGGRWMVIINAKKSADVVLFDGTHYALIDTKYADSYLVKDGKYESGTFNDASDDLEFFLSEYGTTSTGFLGLNRQLRYREGILEKGETCSVSGTGRWVEAKEKGLDIPAQKILVISTKEGKPVYVTDDPGVLK